MNARSSGFEATKAKLPQAEAAECEANGEVRQDAAPHERVTQARLFPPRHRKRGD